MKPPRNGVTIYSKTIRYADGENFPIGGTVIDRWERTDPETAEIITVYKVAGRHWGSIVYHDIAGDDIQSDGYTGEIDVRGCRGLAMRMNQEHAYGGRGRRNAPHLPALLALSNALETRGQVVA